MLRITEKKNTIGRMFAIAAKRDRVIENTSEADKHISLPLNEFTTSPIVLNNEIADVSPFKNTATTGATQPKSNIPQNLSISSLRANPIPALLHRFTCKILERPPNPAFN